MQQTLLHHILQLEERVQKLRDELTSKSRIGIETDRIRAEISVAELALAHYRAAFDLEMRLAASR